MFEYKILEQNMHEARKTLRKLEKIAAKMGRNFSYEFSPTEPVEFKIEDEHGFNVPGETRMKSVWVDAQKLAISFDGDENFLRFDDARFVASIELTDGGAVVLTAPDYDKEIPASYYADHKNYCDHCGHNRPRNRFFLVEKDGQLMQVGSTCIKDFLGIDPNRMLAIFQGLHSFTVGYGDGDDELLLNDLYSGRISFGHSVNQVIEAAAAVLTVDKGYIKGETWERVWDLLYPPHGLTESEHRKYKEFREKYDGVDGNINIDDFKGFVEAMTPNNYTNNLKVIANSTSVGKRQSFAILVSGVYVYFKEIGRMGPVESNKPKYDIVNEWVDAEIKQRLTFNSVQVIGRKLIDSFYGETILYKMLDEAGRPLTWFSSNPVDALEDAYENASVVTSLTATVKKFDEFKGRKQTVVNRGKVIA